MSGLKNEFSWSKTRDEVFKACPRQYWFCYYGYWNGWLESSPERTRQIYVLKNLKNRHLWAGEKVHECIQRSLINIRRGIKVLPVDEIVAITLDQMRAEFRSSKSKNYWKNPKSCGLFEHEYETGVSDREWKGVATHVETCLRNFYASDIYDGLKSHRKEGWLEVEEFSFFDLDHTKVNLVIDCAIKEGEGIYIYDWKTGKSLSEDLSVQLGCYALYALEKWNISPESLSIIEYNLSMDKSSWFSVSQEEMKGIKGYINGSIKDMHSLLADVPNNIPLDEGGFDKIEDERVSLKCNYRKVCRK
ncbi:MAG TPA: PD-(D/E)XK nuclease family protein [Thermodesulfobacteriota bacterium]|nr:PD-(D/E)XK nuclease family protein [Thermodesulfobacteriota bacterium]